MNGEAKKLHIIEKLLAVSDDALLTEIEAVLSKAQNATKKGRRFKDFAGSINDNDLSELEQIIEQGCEQINPNDWK